MIANPSTTKRTKRATKAWGCAISAAVLAGGVTATLSSTASATGIPNLTYYGTISMYASTYTPPITGVKQAPGTIADPEMQDAANAFEKLYPGITINFVPGAREFGTPTWYVSEAAAGNLPDVSWVPGYYVNVTLPTGLFQDLTPAFNQPNPFIPGNTKWISTMNEVALRADTVPGNTPGSSGIFVVNGDWGGIGFYYNKNLFREAGITAAPTTWSQLQADSVQIDVRLASKHVYAGAAIAPYMYNWLAHILGANYLGLGKMSTIFKIPAPYAAAYQSYFYSNDGGWLNPSKNPALTTWFPLGKALMDTWAPKDVNVPFTSGASIDGSTFFLGQQVAYVFINGYAIPREVASLPKSQQFPVGYFEITSLKGTSPYATDLSTWQDNGGPTQSFQYGISSSKSDRSMTTAKTQAALAWLQFISSPKWNSLIVNAEGNDLPIIQGATTSPQLQPILNQLNSESKYYYPMALFDSLTSSSFQTIDGLYLEYVDGYISLGTALSEYDTDAASIISAYNAQHPQLVAETVTYENKVLGIK